MDLRDFFQNYENPSSSLPIYHDSPSLQNSTLSKSSLLMQPYRHPRQQQQLCISQSMSEIKNKEKIVEFSYNGPNPNGDYYTSALSLQQQEQGQQLHSTSLSTLSNYSISSSYEQYEYQSPLNNLYPDYSQQHQQNNVNNHRLYKKSSRTSRKIHRETQNCPYPQQRQQQQNIQNDQPAYYTSIHRHVPYTNDERLPLYLPQQSSNSLDDTSAILPPLPGYIDALKDENNSSVEMTLDVNNAESSNAVIVNNKNNKKNDNLKNFNSNNTIDNSEAILTKKSEFSFNSEDDVDEFVCNTLITIYDEFPMVNDKAKIHECKSMNASPLLEEITNKFPTSTMRITKHQQKSNIIDVESIENQPPSQQLNILVQVEELDNFNETQSEICNFDTNCDNSLDEQQEPIVMYNANEIPEITKSTFDELNDKYSWVGETLDIATCTLQQESLLQKQRQQSESSETIEQIIQQLPLEINEEDVIKANVITEIVDNNDSNKEISSLPLDIIESSRKLYRRSGKVPQKLIKIRDRSSSVKSNTTSESSDEDDEIVRVNTVTNMDSKISPKTTNTEYAQDADNAHYHFCNDNLDEDEDFVINDSDDNNENTKDDSEEESDIEIQEKINSTEKSILKEHPLVEEFDYIIPQTRKLNEYFSNKYQIALNVTRKKIRHSNNLTIPELEYFESITYRVAKTEFDDINSIDPIKTLSSSKMKEIDYYNKLNEIEIDKFLRSLNHDSPKVSYNVPFYRKLVGKLNQSAIVSFESNTQNYAFDKNNINSLFKINSNNSNENVRPNREDTNETTKLSKIFVQDIFVHVQQRYNKNQKNNDMPRKLKIYRSKYLCDALNAINKQLNAVYHKTTNSITDFTSFSYNYECVECEYFPILESILNFLLVNSSNSSKFDLYEGEWILLLYIYWELSTQDLINYDEHKTRVIEKRLLGFLMIRIYKSVMKENGDDKRLKYYIVINALRKLKLHDKKHISLGFLQYIKHYFSLFANNIGESDSKTWNDLFHALDIHHSNCLHTFKELMRRRKSTILNFLQLANDNTDKGLMEMLITPITSSCLINTEFNYITQKNNCIEINFPSSQLRNLTGRKFTNSMIQYLFNDVFKNEKAILNRLIYEVETFYQFFVDMLAEYVKNIGLCYYKNPKDRVLTLINCREFFASRLHNLRKHYCHINCLTRTDVLYTMYEIVKKSFDVTLQLKTNESSNVKFTNEFAVMFFTVINECLSLACNPMLAQFHKNSFDDYTWSVQLISCLEDFRELVIKSYNSIQLPTWYVSSSCIDMDYNQEHMKTIADTRKLWDLINISSIADKDDPLHSTCAADSDDDNISINEEFIRRRSFYHPTTTQLHEYEQTDSDNNDSIDSFIESEDYENTSGVENENNNDEEYNSDVNQIHKQIDIAHREKTKKMSELVCIQPTEASIKNDKRYKDLNASEQYEILHEKRETYKKKCEFIRILEIEDANICNKLTKNEKFTTNTEKKYEDDADIDTESDNHDEDSTNNNDSDREIKDKSKINSIQKLSFNKRLKIKKRKQQQNNDNIDLIRIPPSYSNKIKYQKLAPRIKYNGPVFNKTESLIDFTNLYKLKAFSQLDAKDYSDYELTSPTYNILMHVYKFDDDTIKSMDTNPKCEYELYIYWDKNNEPNKKLFGCISKYGLERGHRACKCVLCPYKPTTTFNIIIDLKVVVSSCLKCLHLINLNIIHNVHTFEYYKTLLKHRILLRFKAPLCFDKDYKFIKEMPPMRGIEDMYAQTYNKRHISYGKRMKMNISIENSDITYQPVEKYKRRKNTNREKDNDEETS